MDRREQKWPPRSFVVSQGCSVFQKAKGRTIKALLIFCTVKNKNEKADDKFHYTQRTHLIFACFKIRKNLLSQLTKETTCKFADIINLKLNTSDKQI